MKSYYTYKPQGFKKLMEQKKPSNGVVDFQFFTKNKKNKNKLYILPTKQGIFFTIMLIVVFIGSLNYNNNAGLAFVSLLAAYLVWSFIKTEGHITKIQIDNVTVLPTQENDYLTIQITASNKTDEVIEGIRLGLERTAYDLQNELIVFHVHPETKNKISFKFKSEIEPFLRGVYPLPRLVLSTKQPFGLARAWTYLWSDENIIVYPIPEEGNPPFPQTKNQFTNDGLKYKKQHSGHELHHIRPYRTGDTLKLISWKSTAKTNQLMVAEMEEPSSESLFLDFDDILLQSLEYEQRISRFAKWIKMAEAENKQWVCKIKEHIIYYNENESVKKAFERLAYLPREKDVVKNEQ